MLNHLTDALRLTSKSGVADRADYMHYDQLGSVIGISGPTGLEAEQRTYHPFGQISHEHVSDIALAEEDKGFLGERYDEDSGLQFLNARYYDPQLAFGGKTVPRTVF